MKRLDLHNTSHANAKILIEEFIILNLEKLPVEIITGNSIDMLEILNTIIVKYELSKSPTNFNNLGSYIIIDKI